MAAAVTRHVGLVARLSLGVETGPVGPRRRRTVDETLGPIGGAVAIRYWLVPRLGKSNAVAKILIARKFMLAAV